MVGKRLALPDQDRSLTVRAALLLYLPLSSLLSSLKESPLTTPWRVCEGVKPLKTSPWTS